MRLYAVLIILVTSMAFLTGYVSLSLKDGLSRFSVDTGDLKRVRQQFEKQVAPLAILDFKDLYYLPGQIKLVNPLYTFSGFKSLIFTNKTNAMNCSEGISSSRKNFINTKEWLWNEYVCGYSQRLPFNFFVKAPYMHSSGFSYPYLAIQLNKDIFSSQDWIRNNIPLFHVTELSEVSKKVGRLDGYYAVLADFSRESLIHLLKSESSILSKDKYLIRTHKRTNTYGLVYKVYKRDHLEEFLNSSRYRVKSWDLYSNCSYRDGQVCWVYSPTALSRLIQESSSYLFYLLVFLLSVIMWMILNRIRADRKEDENRKMALRVLTHEFRTPVTSLLLQMENLTRNSEEHSDLYEKHLKIKDNIYRLKRLTEMSQKYLSSQSKQKMIKFNSTLVSSLNQFFLDILSEFETEISFSGLVIDQSFYLDQYWISICVRNLVENAIKHGQAPVTVQIKKEGKALEICVADAGQATSLDLSRIKNPFVKGNKSEGMGLGLNIVYRTVKEMGGKFVLRKNPTRFYIKIKEGKKNE